MKEHIQIKHMRWIVVYAIRQPDGKIIEYDGLRSETGEIHEPLTVDAFSIGGAIAAAEKYLKDKLPDDGSEFMIYDVGATDDNNFFA